MAPIGLLTIALAFEMGCQQHDLFFMLPKSHRSPLCLG